MKVPREEFRIVRVIAEYEVPDGLSETQYNKLLDEFQLPNEMPYPQKITWSNIDKSILLSIIAKGSENPQPIDNPTIPFESFLDYLKKENEIAFPLEEVAQSIAEYDIAENFKKDIEMSPGVVKLDWYIKLVEERKKFLYERIFNVLEKMQK